MSYTQLVFDPFVEHWIAMNHNLTKKEANYYANKWKSRGFKTRIEKEE